MRSVGTLALFLCVSSISACGTMPAVHMKFVDQETSQPVAGAHVLFIGTAYEGTFSGHGGRRVNLFLLETITNDAGEINVAAQEFLLYPFLLNTHYNAPRMAVFKPGYALPELWGYLPSIARRQDVTNWYYNNRTIKMQRADTDKDISHSVRWAATFAEEAYRDGGDICAWKEIPRFLVAVDRSVNEWNRKRQTPEQSPLRSLLSNDKYYADKGCGSTRDFFDSYLSGAAR